MCKTCDNDVKILLQQAAIPFGNTISKEKQQQVPLREE